MDKRTQIISVIKEQGLMPLYFHASTEVSAEVLKALFNGGCRVIEYTNRGTEALKNFGQLRKICDKELPGIYLGAGTIKDESVANGFISAGADFLVSPGLAEDVFDATYSDKILWIPGCMTVTEIMKAEQFGIELIKLFPGSILGPTYVQAIKEIFPNLSFIPTGGVDLEKENLQAWFRAGVCAVGMGSKLISKTILEKKDFEKISLLAKEALAMIKELRMGLR
jgi:2-dehydro-3-deoxyphosphogluconate aldolase/(4S)-4-hydroxy-2-oxoglutarate aldolase